MKGKEQAGDLIQLFKIVNNLENIKLHKSLIWRNEKMNYSTRCHSKHIIKETFKSRKADDFFSSVNIRKNFITNRIMND